MSIKRSLSFQEDDFRFYTDSMDFFDGTQIDDAVCEDGEEPNRPKGLSLADFIDFGNTLYRFVLHLVV